MSEKEGGKRVLLLDLFGEIYFLHAKSFSNYFPRERKKRYDVRVNKNIECTAVIFIDLPAKNNTHAKRGISLPKRRSCSSRHVFYDLFGK